MSRTGSPSHSRRDSGQNSSFANAGQTGGAHGFRARPSGVPSSSGGGRINNAARGPSPAAAATQQPAMGGRSIGQLLGRAVRLKLHDGGPGGGERWVEGQVWCYDPIPGVVVLEAAGPSKGRQSFRMVKVNQLRELQLVPLDKPPPPPATVAKILDPVRPVNVTAIAMREAQAVKADDARRARIGHGVSRWAQEIFDALGKTLPVRWHNTSIVILDDVLLSGPLYRPEDAKASESNSARLARVRQVLEGEWARLLRSEEGRAMEAEARNSKG